MLRKLGNRRRRRRFVRSRRSRRSEQYCRRWLHDSKQCIWSRRSRSERIWSWREHRAGRDWRNGIWSGSRWCFRQGDAIRNVSIGAGNDWIDIYRIAIYEFTLLQRCDSGRNEFGKWDSADCDRVRSCRNSDDIGEYGVGRRDSDSYESGGIYAEKYR